MVMQNLYHQPQQQERLHRTHSDILPSGLELTISQHCTVIMLLLLHAHPGSVLRLVTAI